jgi:hypothetical protein
MQVLPQNPRSEYPLVYITMHDFSQNATWLSTFSLTFTIKKALFTISTSISSHHHVFHVPKLNKLCQGLTVKIYGHLFF